MKTKVILILCALCVALSGCGVDTMTFDYSGHTNPKEALYETILGDPAKLKKGERSIATWVHAANWNRPFEGFENKDDIWGYDVRSCDISDQDLSVVDNYNDLSYNTDTVWPDTLPEGFDPAYLLEFNKNPGLGIRALHESGVTGEGVGIAIIDQGLMSDHEQYKDNLTYYEKIHCVDKDSAMHGPAVASIAVGDTIGVAPGAKLYYIASTFGHFTDGGYVFDASIMADCILRVLDINRFLTKNEKIRVISISKGYTPQDKGYAELKSAIEKADKENVFVITTSTKGYYDFTLLGLNRDYAANPDDVRSYGIPGWIVEAFPVDSDTVSDRILVPMGSRTYAGWTGTDDYELGYNAGMSWAVPWCAGFYALCCQVKPDITPGEFIDAMKSTGVTTDIEHDGQTYQFGKIVNPAGVIDELEQ